MDRARHVIGFKLKLSVGSGTEAVVSNPVRPNQKHFENPTDGLADSPTRS
jgi:hypothetical protein